MRKFWALNEKKVVLFWCKAEPSSPEKLQITKQKLLRAGSEYRSASGNLVSGILFSFLLSEYGDSKTDHLLYKNNNNARPD